MKPATVIGLFIGQPQQHNDAQGSWTTSLFRERVQVAATVTRLGLAGDRVTQPYHGGPDAALCVHLADHYLYWQEHHGISLQSGAFGENITLGPPVTEEEVCVGDRYRLGTALVEVSAPRVPCANLARRLGHADWVKRTLQANRTGFYLRVLEEGTIQAGNSWCLEHRALSQISISQINRCMFLRFDPALAEQMSTLPELAPWWKNQARQKLAAGDAHWSSNLTS